MTTTVSLDVMPDPDDSSLMTCCVPLRVDGVEVLALLDTGSPATAVVRRPELSPVRSTPTGTGALGVGQLEAWLADVRIEFGGHDLGTMPVEVVAPDHPGHGNLVGQDILRRWCCEYRLSEGLLVLDADPLVDGIDVVVGSRGHVHVDLAWDDGTTAVAIFDTGASTTVVNQAFVEAHPTLFDVVGMGQGIDADGTAVDTPVLRMASVRLLGDEFGPSAAAAVDLAPAIASAERPFDVIIGWPLLSQGSFTIDHENQRARHAW